MKTGVDIAFNDAYGSLELVVDIVGQLAFQTGLVLEGVHGHVVLAFDLDDRAVAFVEEAHQLSRYIAKLVVREVFGRDKTGVRAGPQRKVSQQAYIAAQAPRHQECQGRAQRRYGEDQQVDGI